MIVFMCFSHFFSVWTHLIANLDKLKGKHRNLISKWCPILKTKTNWNRACTWFPTFSDSAAIFVPLSFRKQHTGDFKQATIVTSLLSTLENNRELQKSEVNIVTHSFLCVHSEFFAHIRPRGDRRRHRTGRIFPWRWDRRCARYFFRNDAIAVRYQRG